jgi:N-sulfoglucosamine sulfohydrolase
MQLYCPLAALCGVAFSLALVCAARPAGAAEASRPNVIFILADDMGYGDLGCYGRQKIKTPHIDRMAAEGMRFTQAYCGTSVCAPSRCALMTGQHLGHTPKRPNILWLIAEDMGPEAMSCSGTPQASTPNLDRLAAQGVRYTRFYNGHVCSPSRSSFMTGMYAVTIGAHNHRSHRDDGYKLPEGVRALTDWMRDAGYFTANLVRLPPACGFRGTGKTDWNFTYEGKPFDSANWDDLKIHQPFYAQINFQETHRTYKAPKRADPAKVAIPPYYPDHPVTRADWAAYLDAASELDRKMGLVLKQLETDGLAESTIVVFFGDNGQSHVRGKQFCYEEGLHVPAVIRWPKDFPAPAQFRPGAVDDRLLHGIDLAPTMLDIAGAPKPPKMQGRIFLGGHCEPTREYVFGARDRCDETVMRIRTVRDARWRYIRNFTPEKPFLSPNAYKERQYPVWNLLKELHAQGKLTPAPGFLCQPAMPPEELYDLQTDPHEIHNLATSDQPEHQAALKRLRGVLEKWIEDANDQGRTFEPAEIAAAQGATKPAPKPKTGAKRKSSAKPKAREKVRR